MNRIPGQGPHPQIGNPLFGRYDADPGRYRPQYYYVLISVPVGANGVGQGSVQILNEPFCATRLTHRIIGDFNDPSTTGLYQDGLYSIEFKDEQRWYQNTACPANLMFGWDQTGYVLEFPYPIAFPGNKAIDYRVTNLIARILVPEADYFTVGICMHGITDMGEEQGRS